MRILHKFVLLSLVFSVSVFVHADVATTTVVNGTTTFATSSATTSTSTVSTSIYKDLVLKVPYYKQQYDNSCEAASLRMALAYRGIMKTDVQILAKFIYNPTVKDWVNNIWDDPQKQYVGFVDVSGRPNGGYGVYGLPVLKAVQGFGRTGTYATGTAITAQFLAKEIDAGNPIMVWGYTTLKEAPYTWNTKEGVVVTAVRGEHVRLVTGFKGTVDNPIGFYVHDSFTGKKQEYWPAQTLIDHIQKIPGVTDQAVVVK